MSISLCPALDQAEQSYSADPNPEKAKTKPKSIPEKELPHCRQCGKLARPGVVWFDEKSERLDEINNLVHRADLCLVVGTSSTVRSMIRLNHTDRGNMLVQVRPASGYVYRVQRHHGTVAVFNIEPAPGDARATFVFKGPCEVELPNVLGVTALI